MFRASQVLFLVSLVHHVYAQSTTPTATSTSAVTSSVTSATTSAPSPSPSSSKSCRDIAESHDAGRYSDNFDCGAGGGENSGRKGKTHFIPRNQAPPPASGKLRLLMGRQDATQIYDYQSAPGLIDSLQLSSFTGGIINTFDTSGNLGGNPQVVLSQGERGSVFSDEQLVGRSLFGRAVCNNSNSPIELYSGFGNKVTIVEANIPFDGGIIHITDGFFTPPATLSETLEATSSASRFSSYLASSNSSLDSTPSITVFAPNDAAFLSNLTSNTTLSPNEIGSFLEAHVIEGFAAYSPLLIAGASYKTASGARVNVSITPEGLPIINDNAVVVQPDIIIANGVVHVIDQLLFTPSPVTPPPPEFTGGAGISPLRGNHYGGFVGLMWSVLLGVAVSLYGSIKLQA